MGFAQEVVYEDFEGDDNLPWNETIGDGVVEVVANPAADSVELDPLMINRSDSVGSYMKQSGTGFSLVFAELDSAIDLSANNQFTVQVWAPVATNFILKLEGDGEAIEARRNIAVAERWIEYSFDFSGASEFTTINKLILFFDAGTEDSDDTYLFDNITARPAGECAGVERDPAILDDFECQRNNRVGNPGYLDLTVVDNPDPSGINTSDQVGRYRDTLGAFHALVFETLDGSPLPLAERNQVKIKVWAPVAGRLLFKLERGNSPAVEKDVQITEEETEQWIEYEIDFSDQAGANHDALVFFFNAGVALDTMSQIYFIDDIRLEEPPQAEALEDFEDGGKLTWESLGDPDIFGAFDGIIDNPDQSEPNTSANVGSYTKGSSPLGGLRANLPSDFTLETFPQLDLQVWAPSGANSLTMKLFSPVEGLKEVTVEVPETETWVDLSFNFVEFQSITDFERVEINFDQDLETQDTWFFDNLTQGQQTTDPCEGVEVQPLVIDDFNCQRNASIFFGADDIEAIQNPDPSGINDDPLDQVGQYTDPMGAGTEFEGLGYDLDLSNIDLSLFNQLNLKLWSPKEAPMLFKLQGGTDAPVEIPVDVTTTESWVEYTIDFSSAAESDHDQLVIFFNAGNAPTEEDIYFIDDIAMGRLPLMGCIADFETDGFIPTDWSYFANGDGDDTEFEIIENPDKSGVNMTDSVAVFFEASTGGPANFAGITTDLEGGVQLPTDNETVRAMIWMDQPASVVLKLEQGPGNDQSGDVFAQYTTPNEWQELTWDFSGTIMSGETYNRITLIPNFDAVPMEDKTYYFDQIAAADSECGMTTSIFNPVTVDELSVAPNPVINTLTVNNPQELVRFEVYNSLGQLLKTVQTTARSTVNINLQGLESGMYILTGYDEAGQLRANTKFVKE